MAGGRPTKYNDSFVAVAETVCKLGGTNYDVADSLKVNVATVNRWMNKYPEFCDAIKVAKKEADKRVELSLYTRAVGFDHETVKVMQYQGQPVIIPYTEKVLPDVTAGIFWLKNRDPENWRNNPEPNADEAPKELNISFEVREPVSDVRITNAKPE